MRKLCLICWAALGVILLPDTATGGPITLGTWYEFSFTDPGVQARGCHPADPAGLICSNSGTPSQFLDAPPWTFTSSVPVALTVTDAFVSGDQFEVFDSGLSLGVTSLPVSGADCFDDPVSCLSTPGMSNASFSLGAGSHSITIVPLLSDGGGAGFLQAEAVPEPASILLIALGAAGVSVMRRWQTTKSHPQL